MHSLIRNKNATIPSSSHFSIDSICLTKQMGLYSAQTFGVLAISICPTADHWSVYRDWWSRVEVFPNTVIWNAFSFGMVCVCACARGKHDVRVLLASMGIKSISSHGWWRGFYDSADSCKTGVPVLQGVCQHAENKHVSMGELDWTVSQYRATCSCLIAINLLGAQWVLLPERLIWDCVGCWE